jgi:hypothetical protein
MNGWTFPSTPSLITIRERHGVGGRQGCQMVYFYTKNPNLGKFWMCLQWKMLVYFMAIWSILRPFGIFCGRLLYFMVICKVYFSRFGMLYQDKSGNPGGRHQKPYSNNISSLQRTIIVRDITLQKSGSVKFTWKKGSRVCTGTQKTQIVST